MIAVLIYMTTLSVAVQAQPPDCGSLDVEPTLEVAVNGNDLMFCRTDDLQCCPQQYFERRRNETIDQLREGLKIEFMGDNYLTLKSVVSALDNFINETFLDGFIDHFPGVFAIRPNSRLDLTRTFVRPLFQEFTNNDFDFEVLFSNTIAEILRDIIIDYIAGSSTLNNFQINCIQSRLDDHLVAPVQSDIINKFQQLRSAVTAIKNLTQFYFYDFIPNVSANAPTDACIDRFLTLRCAACIENIPPSCRSVCTPLIRGCFSPFRIGLTAQLDILWNVTQQLFDVVENLVGEIISLEPGIMNIDFESTPEIRTFIQNDVLAGCGAAVFPNFFSAETADNLPNIVIPVVILQNVTRLDGSYIYGEEGPAFCQVSPVVNCWDGNRELDVDREDEFNDDDIQNQNKNPVVSFDRQKLVDLANYLGTPVSDFLVREDFQQLFQDEIIIPPGEAFSLVIMEEVVTNLSSFFIKPSSTKFSEEESFTTSSSSSTPTSSSSSSPTSPPSEGEPNSAADKFASFTIIIFACILLLIFAA